MTKSLFDPHIVPACRYCAYGMASSDGQTILCPKKPQKPVRQAFQQEDFTI